MWKKRDKGKPANQGLAEKMVIKTAMCLLIRQ